MERVRPQPANTTGGRRKSIFVEVGLVDEDTGRRERSPAWILIPDSTPKPLRPVRSVRFRSHADIFEDDGDDIANGNDEWESTSDDDDDDNEDTTRPTIQLQTSQNVNLYAKVYKLGMLALLMALMLPLIHTNPLAPVGVKGGVIPEQRLETTKTLPVIRREDTDTNVCKRWSHQAAIVNGTLYIYGGRSSAESTQTSDTWNNDFLTIDLTKSWQISSPSLTGLPKPSGPPKVANGYLWTSFNSLFLYGGEYSENPVATPDPFSLWEYDIASQQWTEHQDPKTSAGDNAEGDGQSVQRSAEGAGFGVSTLGRGWYFGGHLDFLTTAGWSNQIKRVYLKSLVEFTFPGFSNDGVESLRDGKTAGDEGTWRNITEGGMQDTAGFTERADGLLLYIPGFGDEGILLGLTGGVNESFTQMNVIDVYDIAKSKWYKQTTSGTMPKYRVNPCAVVGAAADGSSYNVYMFGGQNLQPAGNQTQYDDMWILSIPSFKWIEVDQSKESIPYARAGHTCNVWDGQMIVVGGYTDPELGCEFPGVYVFNMSSLQWSDQFTALTGDRSTKAFISGKQDSGNPLAQQSNQRGYDSKAGLEGSYGYLVPQAVQSVIGGEETGGATLTAPVQTATEGPLATGKPQTYTVTGPNGAIITETAVPGASNGGGGGTNIGAIVAGVIAGVFAIIAGYFAFCAWIYRKQVKLWKQHATMATAHNNSTDRNPLSTTNTSTGAPGSSHRTSGEDRINTAYAGASGVAGAEAGTDALGRKNSSASSTDDLLNGQEPTFWGSRGVLLNPRRSLRIVNKD
ncbi:kelch repeat protein-like protein [Polyplosphaeria fusca]|uniref:Kelch repeat protein-like protein n=1 Tax=Polyplosphaeria fusca TaxID=682080 RepID=A0A9P4V686_9PLEO|nr:kelch repeat protein-like protein [Polyplosphaeria fusca]